MSYSCKILLDSISETGKRLTTFEITFPRIVLAEFNTHRMFSRNSASSRAIPFKKRIKELVDNPFIPERFPIDGKGMQPSSYIDKNSPRYFYLLNKWEDAKVSALDVAAKLYSALDDNYTEDNPDQIYREWNWQNDEKPEPAIHKQLVNRLLEPFMWHTVIVTATEFDNFFKLRCDENAQYEIRKIADLMYEAYHAFDYFPDDPENIRQTNKVYVESCDTYVEKPQKLKVGEWHCPLVYEEDDEQILEYLRKEHYAHLSKPIKLRELAVYALTNHYTNIRKKISVARCARVSYLTHDGKRDIEKDLELFERLRTSSHWSPFEHVATPYLAQMKDYSLKEWDVMQDIEIMDLNCNLNSGNFIGWKQFRKEFVDENCTNFKKEN